MSRLFAKPEQPKLEPLAAPAPRRLDAGLPGVKEYPGADVAPARRLLDWLTRECNEEIVTPRTIIRFGPGRLRHRPTIDELTAILVAHGHLIPEKPLYYGKPRWRIVAKGRKEI